MLISIDHHSGVPVFRQIMDQIKFHVGSGLIGPGETLPSTRSLSRQLGLNPMTVSKAFSLLEAEGIVERQRGRPLTVKGQSSADLKASRIELLQPHLEELATRIRQLNVTPDEAVRVLRKIIAEQKEQ